MEWKCLHVEERATREVISLLDWKMCKSSSLARSVMCILVVFGWVFENVYFSIRFLVVLFSIAVQSSLRPLQLLAADNSQLVKDVPLQSFLYRLITQRGVVQLPHATPPPNRSSGEVSLRRPRRWGYD